MSAHGAGPNARRYASHEVAQALGLRGIRWADPLLRERQPVGAPPLPRPRRRHPHQVHPQPVVADEPGRVRAQRPRCPAGHPASAARSQLRLGRHLRLRHGALLESQIPRAGAPHARPSRRARTCVPSEGGWSPAAWSPGPRCGPPAHASARPARTPSMRVQSPTYPDGAYWSWMPPIASSTSGMGVSAGARASRCWRWSSVARSCAGVRVGPAVEAARATRGDMPASSRTDRPEADRFGVHDRLAAGGPAASRHARPGHERPRGRPLRAPGRAGEALRDVTTSAA